ncbi:MAG: UbiD family decarboxylase domain-containing protein, partial [Planctomycetota bacterium]
MAPPNPSTADRSAPLDLRQYLSLLREEGELFEVECEVDTDLEVAEIHRRVIAAGGPALLFKRPKGAKFPLATNLYGTAKRVELAFGRRPQRLIEQVATFAQEALPPTPGQLWANRNLAGTALRLGTKKKGSPASAANVQRPPRLTDLPALKTWPRDGGPFVTLPLVYTEDPETGVHNLGMYRVQVFDDDACGMHIQIHRGGGYHLAKAEALGRDLPLNVFIGGPPALTLGAISPLPENVPELVFTSLLLGEKLRMGKNPAGPLPLVANAEFAIVGHLPANERKPAGPFGDHYGYYSEVHDFP